MRNIYCAIVLLFFTASSAAFSQQGIASWYSDKFHGQTTASGEAYDKSAMTAAHRTLPFGSKIKVRNLENNQEVIVTINDRGPYVEDQIIDLSYAAAKQLGLLSSGATEVEITLGEGDVTKQTTSQETSKKAPVKTASTPKQIVQSSNNGKNYYLQIGAFAEEGNAIAVVNQLQMLRLEGNYLQPFVDRSHTNFYRVRLGPFASETDKMKYRAFLQAAGFEDVYVASP